MKPTLRLRRAILLDRLKVVRVDIVRRARTARAMAEAGFPNWRIRVCLGLSRRALVTALSAPKTRNAGLWSAAERAAMANLMKEAA